MPGNCHTPGKCASSSGKPAPSPPSIVVMSVDEFCACGTYASKVSTTISVFCVGLKGNE